MSDIPSADRVDFLVELLLVQNNLLDGSIAPISGVADLASKYSDQGIAYIAEHGDDQQAILEQLFRGSYDIDDLHEVISNIALYADKIDGDLNTTSILVLPYIEEIQKLTSEDTIDHDALFREIAKLGGVAQTSEIINSISGEDRNDNDIAQFDASLRAMSIIAMNIAEENNVDINIALEELQQEFTVENNSYSMVNQSINNAERNNVSFRSQTSDLVAQARGEEFFSDLENWTRRLTIFADRDDRVPLVPAVKLMLDERDNGNPDFEIALGRNEKLIEGLWNSAKIEDVEKSFLGIEYTGKTDLADETAEFSEYFTAVKAFFEKHGTLEGAEEMFKYDSSNVLSAIENDAIAPSVEEKQNLTVMCTVIPNTPPQI